MADTKQQLTEIIEKYNIGKKPLSKLLGWGVTTVMNQLRSDFASPEFAEKINEIYLSPYAFLEILEQNKRRITDVAYRKARKAVELQIFKDKSTLLVMYLLRHSNHDIAPYQVVAALFYSQAMSVLLSGMPLFDDDIFYVHKSYIPYPGIYAGLIKQETKLVRTEADVLTQAEKDLIGGVNKVLSGFSPNAVRAMLKADKAGLLKVHGVQGADNEDVPVSLSELQTFFSEAVKGIAVNEVKDFKKYCEMRLSKRNS